ncbi:lysine decarboxylase [Dethiosulfatibacter aminovorans DSM 17477]|uniref:Lysine decarboxylase n=1 Tax=Dethiosulfatibacter aminovorans DSM 17477 TaxID=1121476 RepID=A0A1M6CES8_9FIRM|nr:aminotransferase class I/II-fold pyridoxal phosphate-dependent enzyme [Dethiosulfatibacter aminovorans]SHI59507.1 lysine decarboxylase [Dethiosulfatibacter aminovorans DSM 17477]
MKLGEELKKYREAGTARFHMPGHKGISSCLEEVFVLGNDVTEVDGLDNLHKPTGVIKDLLEDISGVYGSYKTLISTNGSTSSLQSAILGVTKPGDSILVDRNCHKSVYNAMILGDLNPVYLMPKCDEESGLSWIEDLAGLEESIRADEKIKAVVLTYPTYFGICCDMEKIAETVHRYDRILIVDEAHGSHLRFCDSLPCSALDAGADIVVQSTHKTLPSLTQSSLLHIRDEKHVEGVSDMISMLLTSSPSYLMMASIEASVDLMDREGSSRLKANMDCVDKMADRYENAGRIFRKRDYFIKRGVHDFDDTRLLFKTSEIGVDGGRAESILRKEYNVQVEMADTNYVNAFMTACDGAYDIERLFAAVNDMVLKYGMTADDEKTGSEDEASMPCTMECPEMAMNMRKAFYSEKTSVDIIDAVGEICGCHITPYPPGIPLLCPGEKITGQLVERIIKISKSGIEVMGLEEGKIKIIKI